MPELYPLLGVPRSYAWGSTTAVQSLRGVAPDGSPIAELWFGAHPDDPSPVADTVLNTLIAAEPARLLGADVVARFGPDLPFLLKILAADKPLSIQVHPTRAQAEAGFEREDAAGIPRDAPNRNYRDRNHKPELLCALTEFEALCGFRLDSEIRALLTLVGLHGLASEPQAAFAELLAIADPLRVVDIVVANAARLSDEWAGARRAVLLAAEHFPGDIGIVLTLFLNYVRLSPGQAIYLDAGNVHCYLGGVGVEIMANSDNVLRCGLTPKHVDVGEVLAITDFTPLADPVLPVADVYPVPVEDFSLRRVEIASGGEIDLESRGGPCIVLCTSGAMTLNSADERVDLTPGCAAFVSASATDCSVRGEGQAFVAGVGALG